MKKGLMIFSNDMEDGEAILTRDLLIRGGVNIKTVSLSDLRSITTVYNLKVEADDLIKNVLLDDFDALILPGGKYVSKVIETNYAELIIEIVKIFNSKDKVIAAICAAPAFLGKAGVLDNKNFTCYPSFENYAKNGYYKEDSKVIKHKNIITSRGAGTIIEFSLEIIKALNGEKAMSEVAKGILFY